MPAWVVIGASRGIGLEFVRQLASNPDTVVVAVVRSKQTAVHLVPLAGPNVHVFEADLCDRESLKAAAAETAKVTDGSVDVLINNGAKTGGEHYFTTMNDYDGIEDAVDQEFMDAYRVNVLGVMWTTLAFIPLLRAGETKKIINISSSAGDLDFVQRIKSRTMVAYSCDKAGLNMLNAKFANQYRDEGFICVSFSPGIVNTEETTPGKPGELPPGFNQALKAISAGYPEWTPIAYTPQESVSKMLDTVARLRPEDNGQFMSEKGTKNMYKD
ncbi:NAD-P-binding protein [Peniophora sp. CONT]|nr:NAD-P-binding protein [Peniophora sp. CONT]